MPALRWKRTSGSGDNPSMARDPKPKEEKWPWYKALWAEKSKVSLCPNWNSYDKQSGSQDSKWQHSGSHQPKWGYHKPQTDNENYNVCSTLVSWLDEHKIDKGARNLLSQRSKECQRQICDEVMNNLQGSSSALLVKRTLAHLAWCKCHIRKGW